MEVPDYFPGSKLDPSNRPPSKSSSLSSPSSSTIPGVPDQTVSFDNHSYVSNESYYGTPGDYYNLGEFAYAVKPERPITGSEKFLDPNLLNRPARPQVAKNTYIEQHATDGEDWNIWYGKRPHFRREDLIARSVSDTRCSILKDAGKTRAKSNALFCVYFAMGRCKLGKDCFYHHRIPTYDDEGKFDLAHDIFGRERHATDREDMGGVGNFNRDCKTLFVGYLKSVSDVEESLQRHFQEWGPIEYVRYIKTKNIAFVRYYMRESAEFAREAMQNQSLDHKECLEIKWASDDQNPLAKVYEDRERHRNSAVALNKRLKIMSSEEQAATYLQLTGVYPETNTQFLGYQVPTNLEQPAFQYHHPCLEPEVHPYTIKQAENAAAAADRDARNSDGLSELTPEHQAQQYNDYSAYYSYYNEQEVWSAYNDYVNTSFTPTYATAEKGLAALEENNNPPIPGTETDQQNYPSVPGTGTDEQNYPPIPGTD
eukprot:TRINITY_DN1493_c0_g1_i1.p1 TRINITY_DN1493_c0_g1~~TRINITY_DN1493_c0_g1_i1.p1  ORF type:complete len:483 (-),score=118.93 TRINITY_DN1493_c0_g1_i1:68-1516(-)